MHFKLSVFKKVCNFFLKNLNILLPSPNNVFAIVQIPDILMYFYFSVKKTNYFIVWCDQLFPPGHPLYYWQNAWIRRRHFENPIPCTLYDGCSYRETVNIKMPKQLLSKRLWSLWIGFKNWLGFYRFFWSDRYSTQPF